MVNTATPSIDVHAPPLVSSSEEKTARPNGTDHSPAKSTTTSKTSSLASIRPTVSFLSDLYLCKSIRAPSVAETGTQNPSPAYIYWSVYTSLAPTLFYFSVWELGIAGHELALLSTLSPVLLGIPPFASWAHTREGRTILYGVSACIGLGAYAVRSPFVRLLLVAFANAAASVGAAVEWFGSKEGEVAYRALGKFSILATSRAADLEFASDRTRLPHILPV